MGTAKIVGEFINMRIAEVEDADLLCWQDRTKKKINIYHATKAEFQKVLPRLQKILDHFAKNKLKG